MSSCYFRGETPKEVFTGDKPNVGHLRIFNCPVYIHVPKEKRTKMEPSRKKRIFVGYSETSKDYHVYVPGQRQIKISRDVTFDEDANLLRSRLSHLNIKMEEHKAPHDDVEDLVLDAPYLDVHKEEYDSLDDTFQPMRPSNRPRDAPPAKRRPI